jgi:purine-binding chemotaxis protein CheW
LRGKIVPVCDLAMRLGLSHDHSDTAKIAVIETHGGVAGVIVDTVEEVLTINTDQIESITSADSDHIDGIAKLDKRLCILLNADGLLSGIHLAA